MSDNPIDRHCILVIKLIKHISRISYLTVEQNEALEISLCTIHIPTSFYDIYYLKTWKMRTTQQGNYLSFEEKMNWIVYCFFRFYTFGSIPKHKSFLKWVKKTYQENSKINFCLSVERLVVRASQMSLVSGRASSQKVIHLFNEMIERIHPGYMYISVE